MDTIPLDAKAKVMKSSGVAGGTQIIGDHAGDGPLVHAVQYVMSKAPEERRKYYIAVPGFSLIRSDAIAKLARRPDFPTN